MQNKKVWLLLAMFTGTVNAANFESPLILPTEIAHTEIASQWVVGHYQNIEQANKVWAHYNVDITLLPAMVSYFDYPYASIEEVSDDVDLMFDTGSPLINNTLTTFASKMSTTTKGHARSPVGDYQLKSMNNVPLVLSEDSVTNKRYQFVYAHEVGHTFGAKHTQANTADSTEELYQNGYGTKLCNVKGTASLMSGFTSYNSANGLPFINGQVGCDQGSADIVALLNHTAIKKAAIMELTGVQTLVASPREDINAQQFEVTFTRSKDIDNAQQATVYVATKVQGHKQAALAPKEIQFSAGSRTAVVTLPFDQVYPLFDNADAKQGTYLVAVTSDEVMPASVNLLDYNTQWPKNNDHGGDSSGGSLSLFWIMMLSLVVYRRRKIAQ
ncbi:GlyGly-CTERM sorting domain-containing protein [Photobacterium phosphoreum]|uniref:GlyGly-CTERM sorting domain-containing protein n=1 Tax=Photobacterium phosphoreum TaxID=659 RepID=A0AAW5A1E4_PHOPO|nr:M12 family metallo-peptidase [Photobacterium phosphoreum]MCD9491472.1 GlyGly-CTERM sorting domain-containing protein [Photobacterium phosphoreum]MCF2190692.1 GlyGly-CTERM sorting domain-containing protein [Photobacterium phosphoreum]MCF2302381.1 GlyGly-CTERM sorting domain-containing protein [Photobacterium phosphoreum]